jgi:hypothetical protein
VEELVGIEGSKAAASDTKYFVTDEVSKFNYLATAFLGEREVQAVRIESL